MAANRAGELHALQDLQLALAREWIYFRPPRTDLDSPHFNCGIHKIELASEPSLEPPLGGIMTRPNDVRKYWAIANESDRADSQLFYSCTLVFETTIRWRRLWM